jgi:hypothetical protein
MHPSAPARILCYPHATYILAEPRPIKTPVTLSAIIVMLLGAVAATLAVRRLQPNEQRSALWAFGAHCVASVVQWALVEFYYGISDVHIYEHEGGQLARLLDVDFVQFAPEVLKLALHMDSKLPMEAFGEGTSTGTMSAISGFFGYAAGTAPLTLYALTCCFSWFGCLCWYRLAREELEFTDRRAALIGTLWVPSVVFWSSGFVKEGLVIGFLGILGLSTYRLLREAHLPSLFGIAFGGTGVAMLKAYTLFAFILATATFIYATRAASKGEGLHVRPAYLLFAAVIGVGGVVAMGQLFPDYSPNHLSETMAYAQGAWHQNSTFGVAGGSDIEMGSGDATTALDQLRFVPLALVTALFRPAIFEARNGPSLAGALENTFLLLAILWLFAGGGRSAARSTLTRTPFILASIVFVLVFGTGVSLATSNLGSLSRYRVTMMPFYVTSVLVLLGRAHAASRAGGPSFVRPARRPVAARTS